MTVIFKPALCGKYLELGSKTNMSGTGKQFLSDRIDALQANLETIKEKNLTARQTLVYLRTYIQNKGFADSLDTAHAVKVIDEELNDIS